MEKIFTDISVSLDGFKVRPKPALEESLGHGGDQLPEGGLKLAALRQPRIVSVLLQDGVRLLKKAGDTKLTKIRIIDSPLLTHLKFRIVE
jgi:hypothetical protein